MSASPRISAEVFAARLAAHPALPSTGGPRRVTHALAKDAGAALPKALRAYLTWEIQGEEGRVGWKPVRGHAWVRSTVCVEHGPSDRELTRVFEVAVSERWLLAACLFDLGGQLAVLPRVQSLVQPSDFYDPRNALLFEIFLALAERGVPLDVVTVCGELRVDEDRTAFALSAADLAALARLQPAPGDRHRV